MKTSAFLRAIGIATLAFTCCAPVHAFLPDAAAALEAIDGLSTVQAALARGREAMARGDALRESPYGYELTVMPLARHENGYGSYGELETMLTRRLRLPTKSRLDGALASSGEEIARYVILDARHEGARHLLDAWMAWARAAGLATLAERQRATAEDERKAVARRTELGELPLLDERRAATALAQADLAAERARLAREEARLALTTDFPTLELPAAPPDPPRPRPATIPPDSVERIVEHNHELALARALAARQGVSAARADAERQPDPSLGLRMLAEADGHEQAVGLVVTIPFAASSQPAMVMAERALTEAIDTEAAGVARRIRLEAEQLVRALPAQHDAWMAAERMVVAADDALARMERAWRLGAVDLGEVLLARRNAYDARVNELGLRFDVQSLAARIEIDSHRRWGNDAQH